MRQWLRVAGRLAVVLPALTAMPVISGRQTAKAAPPPPVQVRLAVAAPGARQTVTVRDGARESVHITVVFPNGAARHTGGETGSRGRFVWRFIQPGNTITRSGRTAQVEVLVGPAEGRTFAAAYRVGFGPLDVVVPHGSVEENSALTLWVHSVPRTRVKVQTLEDGQGAPPVVHRTGARGWLKLPFHAPTPIGHSSTVSVIARAVVGGRAVSSRAGFRVRPFQFSVGVNLQILHRVAGTWVETREVHLGEDVRLGSYSTIVEPAGGSAQCVGGTVEISKDATVLMTLPLQCDPNFNGRGPYVYADTRFTDPAQVGQLGATMRASFENGRATSSLSFVLSA